MEKVKIEDGKVYDDKGQLLGELDHIDEATNTVVVRGHRGVDATEVARLKDDLKKAVHEQAKQPLAHVSYQITNQGKRPKRNGPCPDHPKVKFKNCPCSRKDYNVNLVVHRK